MKSVDVNQFEGVCISPGIFRMDEEMDIIDADYKHIPVGTRVQVALGVDGTVFDVRKKPD